MTVTGTSGRATTQVVTTIRRVRKLRTLRTVVGVHRLDKHDAEFFIWAENMVTLVQLRAFL
jgi:hypothetical protein